MNTLISELHRAQCLKQKANCKHQQKNTLAAYMSSSDVNNLAFLSFAADGSYPQTGKHV